MGQQTQGLILGLVVLFPGCTIPCQTSCEGVDKKHLKWMQGLRVEPGVGLTGPEAQCVCVCVKEGTNGVLPEYPVPELAVYQPHGVEHKYGINIRPVRDKMLKSKPWPNRVPE